MGTRERRLSKRGSTFVVATCWLVVASGCKGPEEGSSTQSLCLPSAPAEALAFNYGPHLEQDDAGNTLLWWWAADDRSTEELDFYGHIQMAAWDGSDFSPARQPDTSDGIALRGSGRWAALRTPEDRIELDTWSPDCGRVTTAVAPLAAAETVPGLATNARGDLVMAWTGVVSDDGAYGLFVARSAADGTLSEPELIFQVQNETVPARVAVDEAGSTAVAFAKVEIVMPGFGRYQTQGVESSGGTFSSPLDLAEGMPFALLGDGGAGRLLAVRSLQVPATTLHLRRFDPERGWTELPDYVCQRPSCDVQFGLLRGSAVLIVERTFLNLHAVVMDEAGAREALTFPEFEVGAALLSHVLTVAPDGTARSLWLTQRAIQTATFDLDSGWSAPAVLLPRPIEVESGWLSSEDGSEVANQYPMRVARLDDGQLLVVWSELGDLVSQTHGDTVSLDATTQTLWSLVTDGTTATVQPVVPGP